MIRVWNSYTQPHLGWETELPLNDFRRFSCDIIGGVRKNAYWIMKYFRNNFNELFIIIFFFLFYDF